MADANQIPFISAMPSTKEAVDTVSDRTYLAQTEFPTALSDAAVKYLENMKLAAEADAATTRGDPAAILLANCAHQKPPAQITKDNPAVNPYPPGTYEHFKAKPNYPKTYDVWKNEALLSRTNPSNSHIKIDLGTQTQRTPGPGLLIF